MNLPMLCFIEKKPDLKLHKDIYDNPQSKVITRSSANTSASTTATTTVNVSNPENKQAKSYSEMVKWIGKIIIGETSKYVVIESVG